MTDNSERILSTFLNETPKIGVLAEETNKSFFYLANSNPMFVFNCVYCCMAAEFQKVQEMANAVSMTLSLKQERVNKSTEYMKYVGRCIVGFLAYNSHILAACMDSLRKTVHLICRILQPKESAI